MKVDVKLVKQLRDETQASIGDCRNALEEANNDLKKAKEILKVKGLAKAAKKGDRATDQGLIESYIHAGGKVGVLLELSCETDFVARTDEFKNLAHEVAMQIAAMNPKTVAILEKQEYIRDPSKKIGDLVKGAIATLGENMTIKRFTRFELGE